MKPDSVLLQALIQDANTKLLGLSKDSLGLDPELDNIRAVIRIANKLAAGKGADEDRARVTGLVHVSIRDQFGL